MKEYASRLGDVDFWGPYVAEILGRQGLTRAGWEPVTGFVGTYPSFVYADVVVKLFGYFPWRDSYAAERAALELIASDPELAAPDLLGEGRLYDDDDAPWPYLILTRVPGIAWRDAHPSAEQRRSIAAELGRQLRLVHTLRPSDDAPFSDWPLLNAAAASERHRAWGSLPPHLIEQIDDYLAGILTVDRASSMPTSPRTMCSSRTAASSGSSIGATRW